MSFRPEDTGVHLLAFDLERRRPACVLIQAALGGDPDFLKRHFSAETWVLDGIAGIRLMPVRDDQVTRLVEIAERATVEQGR